MLFTALSYAQVGINIATPHTSSALDITSTTAGFLPPRMTAVQRILICPKRVKNAITSFFKWILP